MRFSKVFAFLPLAFALLGSPAYADKLDRCGLELQRLLTQIEALRSAPLPFEVLQKRYVDGFDPGIKAADNARFMEALTSGTASQGFFVHLENPVMKDLNTSTGNKGLVSLVTNMGTTIHLNHLEHNGLGVGSSAVRRSYIDYKKVALEVAQDTPQARQAVQTSSAAAGLEFKMTLADLNIVDEKGARPFLDLFPVKKGIEGDPQAWKLGGTGKTPDEAGHTARIARWEYVLTGKAKVHDFAEIVPQSDRILKEIEQYRATLQRAFPEGGIMVGAPTRPNAKVLSEDALAILRKSEGTYGADYHAAKPELREAFSRTFGVVPTDIQLTTLQEYYRLSDFFSPDPYFTERVSLSLLNLDGGAVFVDFVGLGAKNAAATTEALIPGVGEAAVETLERVRSTLHRARAGMNRVTWELNSRQRDFREAIEDVGTGKSVHFSGDDGFFLPKKALSREEQLHILARMGASGKGGDVRVVFLPNKYADGKAIPPSHGHRLIAKGEALEKSIRSRLMNAKNRSKLKELLIGIEYVPESEAGGGTFHVLLSGRAAKDRVLAEEVRRACREELRDRVKAGEKVRMGELVRQPVSTPVSWNVIRHLAEIA